MRQCLSPQQFGFRTRDQGGGRYVELQGPEFARASDIGNRFTLASSCEQVLQPVLLIVRKCAVSLRNKPAAIQTAHVHQQYFRIEAGRGACRLQFTHGGLQDFADCRRHIIQNGVFYVQAINVPRRQAWSAVRSASMSSSSLPSPTRSSLYSVR